jgi:tetratricopeptide (TPR) repeat protein
MFLAQKAHGEIEFVKWIILATLAMALAALCATQVLGYDREPEPLPPEAILGALPMDAEPMVGPQYPEQYPLPTTHDPQQIVWRILELHRRGLAEEALAAWEQAELPCAMDGWKHLAMAATHLQTGNADAAEEMLELAANEEPNHPLLHYYTGILRLTQAKGAQNWLDTLPHGNILLLACLPQVTPNTKAMYELAAMAELEQAIALAPQLNETQPLMPYMQTNPNEPMLPLVTPTVEDYLLALGADHFAARAHNLLGGLYLDHARLEEAEEHWDAATAAGFGTQYAYRELAQAYEQAHRPDDAVRVYHKALTHGDANLLPALKMLENVWQQIWEN